MGQRGPLHQKGLKRRKSRQEAIDAATTIGQVEVDVEAPFEPNEDWHPTAYSLYEAVGHSGQAELYTESDWAKLYLVCDQLSINLKPTFMGFAKTAEVLMVNGREEVHYVNKPIAGIIPMNGATLNAFQAMMTSLGISEGDRRRMGLELTRVKPEGGEDAAAQAQADAAMMAAWASGDPGAVQKAAAGE